jgi:WhiB family transcriptional regulator, redox-sensing transcriptional regulator
MPSDGLKFPRLPGALCKGQDPALWFPRTGQSHAKGVAVCSACPARIRCLDWAIRAGEKAGVWGGTTPEERALIHGARKSKASGRIAD